MPNSANYYGFRPSRHKTGGVIRPSEYRILHSYGTKIHRGDPVALTADGVINLAAAGARIVGIFDGCEWTDTDGTPRFSPYWPAPGGTLGNSFGRARVYDDPNIVYRVRSGGTPAVNSIGALADHVAGTPSDLTGNSGAHLSGTMGTGAAGFRIVDIHPAADNEISQFAELEVMIFEHEFSVDEAATPGV